MSDDERELLLALAEAIGWLAGDPQSMGVPNDVSERIGELEARIWRRMRAAAPSE